jgi:hypothetical protein
MQHVERVDDGGVERKRLCCVMLYDRHRKRQPGVTEPLETITRARTDRYGNTEFGIMTQCDNSSFLSNSGLP